MITLCLIVKNESANISQCLDSFEEVFDQVLIVDTGSSDDTKELARSKGAAVIDFDWIDDFSAARNFALDRVKTPWVMMIDADFRMSTEKATLLRSHMDKDSEQWDLIDLPLEFNGNIAFHPRLWRTKSRLRYRYPVHEYLVITPTLRRTTFQNTLHHVGLKDYPESRRYYIGLMEKYLQKYPHDHRMLYYLVSDNRFLKEYQKAVYWGAEYLKSNPPDDQEVSRVLCHMGFSLWELSLFDDAEKAFRNAMNFDSSILQKGLFFDRSDQELQLFLKKLNSSL